MTATPKPSRAETFIPCVFSFSSGFLRYALVAISSLLKNAAGPYRIYCLVFDLTPSDQRILQRLFARAKAQFVLVPVDTDRFQDWDTGMAHISSATFNRLLTPETVPERRAIYLDSDVLVTCDLGELYDTDLGGAWIGGCVDRKGGRMTTVPLPAGEPYLNAGVLLMDLGRLRANNFFARCNAVRREHADALNFGDQCIINKVAEGRKVVVAPRWNILSHDLEFGQLVPQLESYGGEGVLHFSGITKPWSEWSDQRTADLWFSYATELGIRRQSVLKRPVTINDHVLLAAKHEHERDWEQAAKVRKKLVRTLIIQINEERAKKLEVRT